MATLLLTWNPKNKRYQTGEDSVISLAARIEKDGPQLQRWSTGVRKDVQQGDRVFLLRQSVEPKGIIGCGVAERPSKADWNSFIFRFDVILPPLVYPPLDTRKFKGKLAKVKWGTQVGGIHVEPAEELEIAWQKHLEKSLATDDDPEQDEYSEGRVAYRLHKRRERSSVLVRKAKAEFKKKHGRLFCEVCGFDFEKVYGLIGEDFIEAHHVQHISRKVKNSKTKISDLAIVCANCHRIFHRMKSGTSVEEMKECLK